MCYTRVKCLTPSIPPVDLKEVNRNGRNTPEEKKRVLRFEKKNKSNIFFLQK
jgi:hypothetical protein